MNPDLWKGESYRDFLAERAKQLATNINGFLESLIPAKEAPSPGSHLPELIARGESEKLEFKSSLRWGIPDGGIEKGLERAVLKTIAGFLNGKGGALLIGVADNGTPLGLEGDYASSEKIEDRD